MHSNIQYVNDSNGKLQSVLLPAKEWKKILNKLETSEQQLRVKNDFVAALKEVELMENGKMKKRTFNHLLDEF